MTEDTVREFAHVYKDAVKVAGSLEVRKVMGRTSDWLHSLPPSESTAASSLLIYDCPWDDFRFNHFRGKDGETAASELVALGAAAGHQGGVIDVLLKAR